MPHYRRIVALAACLWILAACAPGHGGPRYAQPGFHGHSAAGHAHAVAPHQGYDTTDYYSINPNYGAKQDLTDLLQAAHGHR